jgi:hypothetical protein
MLTKSMRADLGVMISASHNLFEDNGIKFFAASGDKLPDATEQQIERRLEDPIVTAPSAALGKARRINDAAGRYIEFCKSTFPTDLDLRGLKIVVDCAHGASYHIAPHVLHELGADVVAVGNQPDGLNINRECGATRPQTVAQAVRDNDADLGIALDGDGDRLVMADQSGRLYDGDQPEHVFPRNSPAAYDGLVAGRYFNPAKKWTGTIWFIEGDIKGCFDNIDHEILLSIIQRDIQDGRLIELIRGRGNPPAARGVEGAGGRESERQHELSRGPSAQE